MNICYFRGSSEFASKTHDKFQCQQNFIGSEEEERRKEKRGNLLYSCRLPNIIQSRSALKSGLARPRNNEESIVAQEKQYQHIQP
jgi:hypothetical protein